MNNGWYLVRMGRMFGPYGPEQLQQLATDGQVAPTDLLSTASTGPWMPAANVLPGLSAGPVDLAGLTESTIIASGEPERKRPMKPAESPMDRLRKPMLAAAGATVVVVLVVGMILATLPSRPTRAVDEKPASSTKKPSRGATSRPTPPNVSPTSHAAALRTRDDWLAARGTPLEAHSFARSPHIEVLVWRTGQDRYEIGTLNYAAGSGSVRSGTRMDVEASIDSLHRR